MLTIKFDEISTWENYKLALASYVIQSPKPKTKYVDIPYSSNNIDLSESFGGVNYESREAAFNFVFYDKLTDFKTKHNEVMSLLHGAKAKIIDPRDQEYYLLGRLNVGHLVFDKSVANFTITALCEAFRYKHDLTSIEVSLNGTQQIILENAQKPATVTLITDAAVTIFFNNTSRTYNEGTHILPFVLQKGENILEVSGNAKIKISYQEGVL